MLYNLNKDIMIVMVILCFVMFFFVKKFILFIKSGMLLYKISKGEIYAVELRDNSYFGNTVVVLCCVLVSICYASSMLQKNILEFFRFGITVTIIILAVTAVMDIIKLIFGKKVYLTKDELVAWELKINIKDYDLKIGKSVNEFEDKNTYLMVSNEKYNYKFMVKDNIDEIKEMLGNRIN